MDMDMVPINTQTKSRPFLVSFHKSTATTKNIRFPDLQPHLVMNLAKMYRNQMIHCINVQLIFKYSQFACTQINNEVKKKINHHCDISTISVLVIVFKLG